MTLDRGLAELPVEHRALLVPIDGIGLPYAEASQVLDRPEGTVASRLHHARAARRRTVGTDDESATDEEREEA